MTVRPSPGAAPPQGLTTDDAALDPFNPSVLRKIGSAGKNAPQAAHAYVQSAGTRP